MNTETITMSLFAESDTDPKNERGFTLTPIAGCHTFLMDDDAIDLGAITVTFRTPNNIDANLLRKRAIETLKKKQERVKAEAYQVHLELQGKIDKLRLLTANPHEVVL